MTLTEALYSYTVNDLKQRRVHLPNGSGLNRKADLVAAISGHLLSDALATTVAQLTDLERNAVAEAVHNWQGWFDGVGFKAKYGSVPKSFTRSSYGYYSRREEPSPPSPLEILFYNRHVPPDLAERLAALVPPPAPLVIATLGDDQLPETIARGAEDDHVRLRRADTEPRVRQELPALLRLVAQGKLAVGAKTGLPSAAAIGRIEALLLDGDWYSAEDDEEAPRYAGGSIRPIRPFAWPLLLQAGGLAKIDGSKLALTPRGKKALSQPLHEVVAHLFERWQSKGPPDELRRVDLIKGQTAKGVKLSPPLDRRQVIEDALRACCPVGQWMAVDDLFRLMKAEHHRFEVAGNPWKLYFVDANYGSLGYDGGDAFEILEARYTLVYLFEYLATLGLIDVAYTLPYDARPDFGGRWGVDEFSFLSRYDGLSYVRLNDLGAYCLDLSETYSPRLPERPALLRVESDLSLTQLRPSDPAEQLQLEQIANAESPERWRLNADEILTQGANPEDRERIRDFVQTALEGDLPPELDEWLASLEERATALVDGGTARLIQCRDAALAAMLSSDPATAAHCHRAGDRLLCVPEKKLTAFRKGLARLDFVLPELKP
ncbi:hypothetical protein [Thiorhodovibrio frisius]|uniref:Helicase XPB/Ssl2 N-terminal domain-containing protein n=1 Tax=Thiorhodovibrio frisius TaxID=631362 RepID=H8YY55_9GAMM|nr:hypothetical protein [Thiorhodovibrio frisius]EIC23381.1 hypothetical protein Thi970DRAFT_01043 [Thiorhodovibrio frisius]WPL23538.1 hypothetical protein Thiofri_03728 [Thiorhodovibrio frisius]